jgi:hypothetical protein
MCRGPSGDNERYMVCYAGDSPAGTPAADDATTHERAATS